MLLAISFEKIAPYLSDPLVLIGFMLFLFFLTTRVIIVQGIIPTVTQNQGFSFLKLLLLYGFIIGLVVIALGFGLKYREMSKQDQKRVVMLLSQELKNNLQVVGELKKNTESLLQGQLTVSQVLRTEGIKILPVMFPLINVDLDSNVNTNQLAQLAFQNLAASNLANNSTEVKKLEDFAIALNETLNTIRGTNENLRDKERVRYVFNNQQWDANLEHYKKIDVIDVTKFQEVYSHMANMRNDYDVVAGSVIDFNSTLANYFHADRELNWGNLAVVLSSERQSYSLIVAYSKILVDAIEDITNIQKELDQKLETI